MQLARQNQQPDERTLRKGRGCVCDIEEQVALSPRTRLNEKGREEEEDRHGR
jgi:hypothetical protein